LRGRASLQKAVAAIDVDIDHALTAAANRATLAYLSQPAFTPAGRACA
jgi:hypothetical protein